MDILRNIEKKILNIANNNTNDINSLKADIKMYLDNINNQQDITFQKKNKYEELYENKRKLAHISYENYLSVKAELMKEIEKDKTKGAIIKYLEHKYDTEDIPDIYTYENISLDNVNNVAPTLLKPVPPKEPKKYPKDIKERKVIKAPKPPTVPKKAPKPTEPPSVPSNPLIVPTEPTVIQPAIPNENVIEPMVPKPPTKPKKLPKILNEPKLQPTAPNAAVPITTEPTEPSMVPPKPPNKLPKLNKDAKECPEGEEINPKTGKCVKKCKEGEIRNTITGRCNKIKESKPSKAIKAAKKVNVVNAAKEAPTV